MANIERFDRPNYLLVRLDTNTRCAIFRQHKSIASAGITTTNKQGRHSSRLLRRSHSLSLSFSLRLQIAALHHQHCLSFQLIPMLCPCVSASLATTISTLRCAYSHTQNGICSNLESLFVLCLFVCFFLCSFDLRVSRRHLKQI